MRVIATKSPLKVAYKIKGKNYSVNVGESVTAPFDEEVVALGASYDLPAGAELVAVTEMDAGHGLVITDSETGAVLAGAGGKLVPATGEQSV